ncbi:hypothetical protein [Bacillus sp. V59.32b]|uniref:hypothetical protein n=1 Tax=Bacillus sp. V59.32b TaxID=1758642 RepID=UPI000E3CBF7F|nr:hypothetical protein [Bacillus sp. V59.32b]RFU69316.1 hypothetical protein D0463_02810 [Bacillus sp. V59.32b]
MTKGRYKKIDMPLEIEQWPDVDISVLNIEKQTVFLNRKKAVILYLTTEISLEDIFKQTGIVKQDLYRLI